MWWAGLAAGATSCFWVADFYVRPSQGGPGQGKVRQGQAGSHLLVPVKHLLVPVKHLLVPVKHLAPLVHQQTFDRTFGPSSSKSNHCQPLKKMGESQTPERKCEEGVEERVGKFEMVDKVEQVKEGEGALVDLIKEEDERIEKAKQKVKLWLTNNFGEPDIIELMIPAR